MSLAPIDVMEEDAADLQFPKEKYIIEINPGEFTRRTIQHYKAQIPIEQSPFDYYCDSCQHGLLEPYIDCAECTQMFCITCFARGAETTQHKNNHAYIIRHDNMKIFPTSNWSAKEEKKLLDLILSYGYGNWDDISKSLGTKNANECREHYLNYYFGGIFEKMLGLSREPYFPETIPYLYKMNSLDPPRQDIDLVNFKTMAGYRCARGDFDTPYDNSAESIVSNLQLKNWDDDENVGDELNCAVFKAYNNRLRERNRRYKVMREHGLILTSRTQSWLAKHADALGLAQCGKSGSNGRFVAFMQLTSGVAFDGIVESMQYAHDLINYIFKLYELRKNGVYTFYGGKLFHKLRTRRLSKIKDKRSEQYDITWDWKQLVPSYTPTGPNAPLLPNYLFLTNPSIKRKSTPLDILGLPAYDKLNEEEKKLCSTVRLVPTAYLGYKSILMAENTKTGYLRLADARRLIKIDVNKTRQLYDFFLLSGFINKPFS